MNWHYVEQGQQRGPVNDDWLIELDRTGRINADTLVWHEGMKEWKPLREVRSDLKPSGLPLDPKTGPDAASAAVESEIKPAVRLGENGPEAVCSECGKIFPVDEMIQHGNVRICANCKPVFMQKLSEGARIDPKEMRYAGFWIRVVAKILDMLIFGFTVGIVIGIASALVLASVHNQNSPLPVVFVGILELCAIIFQAVYVIYFVGKFGATPGKMICKLKIVTPEGGSFGYGRATGRFFAEMLSGMICYIGYIMVAFDQEKRGLHDHICKTRVVYK